MAVVRKDIRISYGIKDMVRILSAAKAFGDDSHAPLRDADRAGSERVGDRAIVRFDVD